MERRPGSDSTPRSRRVTVAIVGYAVIVGALLAWQAVGLLNQGDDWPTLSELLRKVTRTAAGRYLLFASWLWVGWHLFVRGWRFLLRT